MDREKDKIYRRKTQFGDTPKKKKDEKARKRNVIMNFRVTPQEKELIEQRIAISGMPKAEFFIQSCMYQTILVRGNVKTFDELRGQIREIEKVFNQSIADREDALSGFGLKELESLRMILELFQAVYRRGEE